ncbi:flagella synthesis protein FlgN [Methylophilus rhizosphaerae]|uniref:Flagella synthesis protein FlgN n=1 Tax=Methylophilus rhizosphaerae TaxID=492660 RepID=A0A1G8ZD18_9PROT|nr:flagellar protein FlgN [Methylophilus rhizosphaerae]SDK12295.1 flagella synthesis protein FlgN [Methylophilus rhizosphaerae]
MNTANQTSMPAISFDADAMLVAKLIQDLQHEQTALVSADMATIEKLVDNRAELLQALGEAANQRYVALAAAGFEGNETGMEKWLKLRSSQGTDRAWMDFQQQLAQAKELNRLNGLLINKHFQRNQERLDVLQGKSSGSTQLYGKNGQAHAANSSRTSFSV